jgi:hypothetical protein
MEQVQEVAVEVVLLAVAVQAALEEQMVITVAQETTLQLAVAVAVQVP